MASWWKSHKKVVGKADYLPGKLTDLHIYLKGEKHQLGDFFQESFQNKNNCNKLKIIFIFSIFEKKNKVIYCHINTHILLGP